ncbi:hypothetical protein VTN31DRAFT_5099 [Thermomyces dupontii]|uniref:uncharacterized protein n=1 Tax=Talaromyces thermophilus TaxID=28565 RepID=UPI00374468C4
MSSKSYLLVEPHPSVPKHRPAIYTGRGGAGNVVSLQNTNVTHPQTATGPASAAPPDHLRKAMPTTFPTGRGGAGNMHHHHHHHDCSERAIFSFDEELELEMRRERDVAPVFHVGRGGAGNVVFHAPAAVDDGAPAGCSRKLTSESSSSAGSSSSETFANKARQSIERTWNRLTS